MTENYSTTKTTTPEYNTWKGIKRRTLNPNFKHYHNYGGRGIKVCDRWLAFDNFLEDMGKKPSPDHSIDRIDTNGDYTPENCRWTTRSVQNQNQRIRKTNNSGYRGVSWSKPRNGRQGRWVANIWKDLTRMYLGCSINPEEAALIYDAAAIQLYGETAQTNILGATQ